MYSTVDTEHHYAASVPSSTSSYSAYGPVLRLHQTLPPGSTSMLPVLAAGAVDLCSLLICVLGLDSGAGAGYSQDQVMAVLTEQMMHALPLHSSVQPEPGYGTVVNVCRMLPVACVFEILVFLYIQWLSIFFVNPIRTLLYAPFFRITRLQPAPSALYLPHAYGSLLNPRPGSKHIEVFTCAVCWTLILSSVCRRHQNILIVQVYYVFMYYCDLC